MDVNTERASSEGCWTAACSSPRRIISRLFCRSKEKRCVREKERGGEALCRRCSMNGFDEAGDSVVLESDELGRHRKEVYFNLGAGFGLLYLVAASKNEVSRMTELRSQMEILLHNVKEELHRKNSLSKVSRLNDNFAYSSTDVSEGSNSDSLRSPQLQTSYFLPKSETIILYDHSSNCHVSKQEDCVEGIDQLETELQVELERLQFHLDTENLSKHLQPKNLKVAIKDTDSARTYSTISAEVIDHLEGNELHFGVPPYELERRLHEVLETRQQERIKELEAAVECLEHKIHEKEIEVSWWQDTAKLISQHIPETTRLAFQHGS